MALRVRSMLLALACGSLAACSLIAGLTEDYRAGDGGAVAPGQDAPSGDGMIDPDGPGADGSMPGVDAGDAMPPVDAKVFCAITDAGPNNDGFCDDFETVYAGPNYNWTGTIRDRDAAVFVPCAIVKCGKPGA